MDKLSYGASVIGLAVVGAMVATMVNINMPMKFGSGDDAVTIQSVFDGIVPGILALGFTFFIFWLDKKRTKSTLDSFINRRNWDFRSVHRFIKISR